MTAVGIKSWTGKVAVVTGAGSGMGQSVALRLAQAGASVAISDIDADAVEQTAVRCRKMGVSASAYQLDVADRDAVFHHADEVVREFGRVNFVLNNAGVTTQAQISSMSANQLCRVMDINFFGVVNGTQAFLPHLIASGEGHIANTSSVLGFIGAPTQSAYSASKFAVRGFTETLRQEMLISGHPVGVSCIHPGGVRTNIVSSIDGLEAKERDRLGKAFTRMARTSSDDAARVILRGVYWGKAKINVGPDAYVIDAIPRVLGSTYQRIVSGLATKVSR